MSFILIETGKNTNALQRVISVFDNVEDAKKFSGTTNFSDDYNFPLKNSLSPSYIIIEPKNNRVLTKDDMIVFFKTSDHEMRVLFCNQKDRDEIFEELHEIMFDSIGDDNEYNKLKDSNFELFNKNGSFNSETQSVNLVPLRYENFKSGSPSKQSESVQSSFSPFGKGSGFGQSKSNKVSSSPFGKASVFDESSASDFGESPFVAASTSPFVATSTSPFDKASTKESIQSFPFTNLNSLPFGTFSSSNGFLDAPPKPTILPLPIGKSPFNSAPKSKSTPKKDQSNVGCAKVKIGDGKLCTRKAIDGSLYCSQHKKSEEKGSLSNSSTPQAEKVNKSEIKVLEPAKSKPEKIICNGKTKAGATCKKFATAGSEKCSLHANQ